MQFLVVLVGLVSQSQTVAGLTLHSDNQGGSAAWAAAARDDHRALVASWKALEGDLHSLLGQRSNFLQLSSPNKTLMSSDQAMAKLHSQLAGSKNSMGKAMLAPALAMMHGLVDEQKERIATLNKREQKSKERFAEQQKEHDGRMAHFKDLIDHHRISEGFYKNSTADENRMFKYWRDVRDRAHRGFHNQLKLTHGLMAKEKTMIAAYDKALAGPEPKQHGKATAPKVVQSAPDIVFVQMSDLSVFCVQALGSVGEELSALEAVP